MSGEPTSNSKRDYYLAYNRLTWGVPDTDRMIGGRTFRQFLMRCTFVLPGSCLVHAGWCPLCGR